MPKRLNHQKDALPLAFCQAQIIIVLLKNVVASYSGRIIWKTIHIDFNFVFKDSNSLKPNKRKLYMSTHNT